MELNIDAWMGQLEGKLREEFNERLVLLGLQGSRARGEARADSDIDVVAVISGLDSFGLQAYKDAVSSVPHTELACGFVSSPRVLAAWPRYDSFNLVMDTKPYYGTFDFMDTDYSADDAIAAAKAGASAIYHAMCHGVLFDGDALSGIISSCIKSAFFVMRAQAYARTGEYPDSRSRMRELATEDEKTFLDAYNDPESFDLSTLANELLHWSSSVLTDSL